MRVGIIGVGNISGQYLAQIPTLPGLQLVAIADLDATRAAEVAAEHGARALSVDELLTDPEVDAVLVLTTPQSHAELSLRAVQAGKHVYLEKPLALATAEAAPVLAEAAARGVRVGCAPDTVLGTGIQTARALIDDGTIGTPLGAHVAWSAPGHELWHPNPAFYYQPGAGPLFDMGPYYLSSLLTFFGPVARVHGATSRSQRAREVATGPQAGTGIEVNVDTHVTALLEHASGVISTVTVSFEVWATQVPLFEVYGTQGSIAVTDPNTFTGTTKVATRANREFVDVPVAAGYADAGRGVGLADLARGVETDRPHRANGELAFHLLEVMEAILTAGAEHRVVEVESRCERPAPVPLGATPDTW